MHRGAERPRPEANSVVDDLLNNRRQMFHRRKHSVRPTIRLRPLSTEWHRGTVAPWHRGTVAPWHRGAGVCVLSFAAAGAAHTSKRAHMKNSIAALLVVVAC